MSISPIFEQLPSPPNGKKEWPWIGNLIEQPSDLNKVNFYPKISIVTPSFNQGKFLEETIRSVLLQGYPNLEYIIIDGSSTDNSVEIIKKYEKWLSYWVSEKDNGQSHAINKGLQMATGDILAWINSDDFYQPDCFFNVVNKLPINKPAWVQGSCRIISEDYQLLYIKKMEQPNTNYKLFIDWLNRWIPQQSMFWNRQIQNQIGILDNGLNYVMDVDFIYRLSNCTPPIIIENELSNYRMQRSAKSINQADSSKIELFDWIDRSILSNEKIGPEARLHLINEMIRLKNDVAKLANLKNHLVIGKIIAFWKRYINRNFEI